MAKPVLAFTSGDPAGVGPEAVVAAVSDRRLISGCEPILVGEPGVWRRAGWRPGLAPMRDTGLGLKPPPFGNSTREGGRLSFASAAEALRLVARGLARGLVTAPISKTGWKSAGVPYPDHTEWLKDSTGAEPEMILACPSRGLWCVTATRHLPLMEAIPRLDVARITAAAGALAGALALRGKARPRLGLCAVNPHAGEGGLLGSEERNVLSPAAAASRARGLRLEGPLPADCAWRLHREGRLDGLVCLYHDQALIGLKAMAGLEVVNWSVGLPFIRTSPGHGTAFDIAGRAEADPGPTLAAALLAVELAGPIGPSRGGSNIRPRRP